MAAEGTTLLLKVSQTHLNGTRHDGQELLSYFEAGEHERTLGDSHDDDYLPGLGIALGMIQSTTQLLF